MGWKIDEPRIKEEIIAMWRRGGGDAPAKVMPAGLLARADLQSGYITQLKFLIGRTPAEMEAIVGFRAGSKLAGGADIYSLPILPRAGQFAFRGYSNTSGGVSVTERPFDPDYPPGSGCPQWELIDYPQTMLSLLKTVPPGVRFSMT